MDAFSEVLSGVRLKGAMFFSAEFSAPWQLSTPHCRVLAPTLSPGAPHIVIYHFVVDGEARACVEGGADIALSAGDIVVFPHGDPHLLSAGSGTNQVESASVLQRIVTGDLSPMQGGGGGATTRFVCGYLTLDPLLCGPILESLPSMLKVNVRTDRSGHWLEQTILHLLDEAASDRAGSDAMLAKLSEALFVDTLRRYVGGLPDQTTGWLAGARDPVVGKSLALMHRRAHHPWTTLHALPDGSADDLPDRLAIAPRRRGVDVVLEGRRRYRRRGGLRIRSGVQSRVQACLRSAAGALPAANAEAGELRNGSDKNGIVDIVLVINQWTSPAPP